MTKLKSARQAIEMIGNGVTLATGGTGPVLEPDLLLNALETRFLETGAPTGMTLFTPMLPGDRLGKGGVNAVAHPGMLKKLIGASFSNYRHPCFWTRFGQMHLKPIPSACR